MNGVLRKSLTNPWLASLVSFLPIIALLGVLWFCLPRPLPTAEGIGAMPLGFQALKDIVVILHKGVPPLRVAERG